MVDLVHPIVGHSTERLLLTGGLGELPGDIPDNCESLSGVRDLRQICLSIVRRQFYGSGKREN